MEKRSAKIRWEWIPYRMLWEYIYGVGRRQGATAAMARYLLLVQQVQIGAHGIWLPTLGYQSARGKRL